MQLKIYERALLAAQITRQCYDHNIILRLDNWVTNAVNKHRIEVRDGTRHLNDKADYTTSESGIIRFIKKTKLKPYLNPIAIDVLLGG